MGQFDQAARYAAKLDPAGFLHWLMPAAVATLRYNGWLDTRTLPFPGEPDRTCDTVADFASSLYPQQPWAVVVEFQTEPDRRMPVRLLEYLSRLLRELRSSER